MCQITTRAPSLERDILSGMQPGLGLTERAFGEHFHACAFVTSAEEGEGIAESFLEIGMRRGSRAMYIVDPVKQGETQRRLEARAPAPDLLEITTWDDAHLSGGAFDGARMMDSLEEMVRSNASLGRPPMRVVGQMGWVPQRAAEPHALVAYEATVNEVLNAGRTPTICVYQLSLLPGALMMDLLRAHPLAIVNGVLYENPFYTRAEKLLEELARRPKPS